MTNKNYKKYMKKNKQNSLNLLQLFGVSFFGMLLVFTFLIKSFSPSVDVSIGENTQGVEVEVPEEVKNNVDNRLAMIQSEDQGRSFSELMKKAEDDTKDETEPLKPLTKEPKAENDSLQQEEQQISSNTDPVYKVFIGTYTSAEQAKVAKDIIIESGSNLTPLVKCIGSNNYTLQVGIFKNKQSADALLYTIQQNHLPGRIVAEY